MTILETLFSNLLKPTMNQPRSNLICCHLIANLNCMLLLSIFFSTSLGIRTLDPRTLLEHKLQIETFGPSPLSKWETGFHLEDSRASNNGSNCCRCAGRGPGPGFEPCCNQKKKSRKHELMKITIKVLALEQWHALSLAIYCKLERGY